jgi:hypothetical protein
MYAVGFGRSPAGPRSPGWSSRSAKRPGPVTHLVFRTTRGKRLKPTAGRSYSRSSSRTIPPASSVAAPWAVRVRPPSVERHADGRAVRRGSELRRLALAAALRRVGYATTHRSGRSSATSDNKPSTARPRRKRFGTGPALTPNVVASVAVRVGKPIEAVEHRSAQLMQRGKGQLHLRLDPDGADDPQVRRCVNRILEQRRLANPRLAAHHQHPPLRPLHAASSSPSSTAHSARRPRSTTRR